MIDLSSSMTGTPMINAITLGLFTASLLDNSRMDEPESPFSNRFMTFNSNPELAKLPRGESLYEKIKTLKRDNWMKRWGGTTNISSAINLLLQIGVNGKVPPEKMPKILAIFSDMQFDKGDNTWGVTSYEQIKSKFEEMSYTIPHIVFWNLRAKTPGFQVSASCPNVTMLSGYSTRMMDLFLTSSLNEIQSSIPAQKEKTNTLSLMESIYSNEMFEKVEKQIQALFNPTKVSSTLSEEDGDRGEEDGGEEEDRGEEDRGEEDGDRGEEDGDRGEEDGDRGEEDGDRGEEDGDRGEEDGGEDEGFTKEETVKSSEQNEQTSNTNQTPQLVEGCMVA
jgi:hypothetical protein